MATRHDLAKLVEGMTEGPWVGDCRDGSVKYRVSGKHGVGVMDVDNKNGEYGFRDNQDEVGTLALRNCAPALLGLLEEARGWVRVRENGHHHCRHCDAGTHNKWAHHKNCTWKREQERARDLLARIDGELDEQQP